MDKRAILCVDDEAIQNLSIKRELEHAFGARFIVETACNAHMALDALRTLDANGIAPFMLITDWLMPDIHGDELIQRVKALFPGIHAIMITGQADGQVKLACRESGEVLGILGKPWSRSELISLIEQASGSSVLAT